MGDFRRTSGQLAIPLRPTRAATAGLALPPRFLPTPAPKTVHMLVVAAIAALLTLAQGLRFLACVLLWVPPRTD